MTYTKPFLCVVVLVWVGSVSAPPPGPVGRRGAMSYVVSRGCPFMAHYVRDNYFRPLPGLSPDVATTTTTPSSPVNWVVFVYNISVANYVPMELVHGMVNCGTEYALYSVDAPQWLVHSLHVDYSSIPGAIPPVGK